MFRLQGQCRMTRTFPAVYIYVMASTVCLISVFSRFFSRVVIAVQKLLSKALVLQWTLRLLEDQHTALRLALPAAVLRPLQR